MVKEIKQTHDFLLERLEQNVKATGLKTAVSFLEPGPDGGKIAKSLTYEALWEETMKVAVILKEQGLKGGDRAVLVYPPSLDFMIAFLACLKLSVIAVPVFPPNPNRRDTLQMFAKIVQSCEPSVALTNKEYNHMKKLVAIRDSVATFKRRTSDWPENLKWVTTDTKPGKCPDPSLIERISVGMDDVAFLQFTSGSTSEPKGVMITHGNLAHNLTIITNDLEASDDTVVVSWLPQYHDMGLIGSYLGALYCGGSGYYMSPLSFLQRPMLWIEAVSRFKATHLQAPNFAFKLTARKFQSSDYSAKKLDLSSVRHVINAAEPVDEESIETFYKHFGPYGFRKVIFPTYGLAEHTVFVCSGGKQRLAVDKETLETVGTVVTADSSSSEIENVSKLVGCGYPERQKVDVRIVHLETLEAVGEGKVGEIWIRSPSKAAGYYNKKEETERDFHGQIKGSDVEGGFLRTGDLGFFHNKELFICGRLKDLIIVGGRNYYPQDIEATAESTSEMLRPGCSAAFTIDQTHVGGEEVALIMELKEVPSATNISRICDPLANEIKAAVNQEHSLGLAEIVFLTPRSVPKTSSGKIARSWCRKGYVAGTLSVVYRKNFVSPKSALEIESSGAANQPRTNPPVGAQAIRQMSKKELLARLVADVARVGSMPPGSIDKNAALATILNSLDLSQFKGLYEANYACKISDEYMFRDTTTVSKLADIAQLGHAPDDVNGNQGSSQQNRSPQTVVTGKAGGLAGALGCPPGVRCTIL